MCLRFRHQKQRRRRVCSGKHEEERTRRATQLLQRGSRRAHKLATTTNVVHRPLFGEEAVKTEGLLSQRRRFRRHLWKPTTWYGLPGFLEGLPSRPRSLPQAVARDGTPCSLKTSSPSSGVRPQLLPLPVSFRTLFFPSCRARVARYSSRSTRFRPLSSAPVRDASVSIQSWVRYGPIFWHLWLPTTPLFLPRVVVQ